MAAANASGKAPMRKGPDMQMIAWVSTAGVVTDPSLAIDVGRSVGGDPL